MAPRRLWQTDGDHDSWTQLAWYMEVCQVWRLLQRVASTCPKPVGQLQPAKAEVDEDYRNNPEKVCVGGRDTGLKRSGAAKKVLGVVGGSGQENNSRRYKQM
ncbi:hypothetical protein AOLI_G00015520 [Acnodon oligacanthus]